MSELKPELKTIKLSEVVFDQVIYPRADHNPALVQKYADDIEQIEEHKNFISLSSDMKILDGKHRWLAYRKINGDNDIDIQVYVYPVSTPHEELLLATELNSSHGYQLEKKDKEKTAKALYAFGIPQETIAKSLSVKTKNVNEWLKDVLKAKKDAENEIIFNMYLSCYTLDDIANKINIDKSTVSRRIDECCKNFLGNKSNKDLVNYEEQDWKIPVYNIWSYGKKTNDVGIFGNTEQRIVDNLLYTFTEPFDIVVDPFAGGGSTIDVCKTRGRRYWASDRKPIVERETEIRVHDIKDGVPALNKNWDKVTLTYLDPPYWRQAQNKYSEDKEDLANMELKDFTKSIVGFTNDIMKKQSKGAVALIIQPTQWRTNDNHDFTDHVMDICQGVKNDKFKLFNRVSCPYSTEQDNAQMVNKAKADKFWLVLTRELIVWKCI
jgi:hypothetical protein